MLTEERYLKILESLNEHKTVTVIRLSEVLNVSESTIRRDLNSLASMNKIVKVHGGATVLNEKINFNAYVNEARNEMFANEKNAIAQYAASTIQKNDFVFIDSGTTTEKMINFILEPTAVFVTNCFSHAKKLADRKFKVYIIGGQIKASSETVIGTECIEALKKFNFTKCYMGTNGISLTAGFTTPDADEAMVKKTVIFQSGASYILADHSKFNQISSVTFSNVDSACIITDYLSNKSFNEKCIVKEVIE